jgi:DNA gyrase/topoisomerase IV subunit A
MKKGKQIFYLLAAVILAGTIASAEEISTAGVDLGALAMQAAGMSKPDLLSKIEQYKDLIGDKTQLLNTLQSRLKEIPWTERMGEEAKSLKSQIRDTASIISQLKKQLTVYTDALKAVQ